MSWEMRMQLLEQTTLDTVLTDPPAELCVNCEREAAANWLLCLACVAMLDEAMLIRLTKKYALLAEWLAEAEEALRDMPRGAPQFIDKWELWSAKFRVHQRLGWLWGRVKAA